jgi:hypothetical protein
MISYWEPETGNGGSIYKAEIGKHYKSGLGSFFLLENHLLSIYQHITAHTNMTIWQGREDTPMSKLPAFLPSSHLPESGNL